MANHISNSNNINNNDINKNIISDVAIEIPSLARASSLKLANKYTSTITTPITTNTTTTTNQQLVTPNTNPTYKNTMNYTAIADTAATGHYITQECPVVDKRSTNYGVNVTLPDGNSINSTHTALLQLPSQLPINARTAHIFPDLKSGSLISIGQLCDHNCTAIFDATQVKIYYKDAIIMSGARSINTNNLWVLELDDLPNQTTTNVVTFADSSVSTTSVGTANSLVAHDTMSERIAFYHATCFSPVISTWCDAIDAGHFTTWPELTSARVRKHLPRGSIPMIKGHLHQQRANIQSTKKHPNNPVIETTPTTTEPENDFTPTPTSPPEQRSGAVLVQIIEITGKSYSDQTGKFLATSSSGNNYVLVLYEYDSNSIHGVAIKNRTAAEIKRAFSTIIEILKSRGLLPKLQILDNEASTLLLNYIDNEGIDYQLAPPNVHRRNAAERAISTYKDHLIAGLSSTDTKYPLHLWDQLIPQANITLNLLRRSRINPQLSAYAHLYGAFDFNKTPMAPPGTRVLVHEKPAVRQSWDPRAIDAWYLGPALKHYRCYRVWVWETQHERIADTLAWFPTRVKMPTLSSVDLVLAAAKDLITALQNPSPGSPLAPTTDSQTAALKQLADIFQDCAQRSPLLEATKGASEPRVNPSYEPSTMTSPEVRAAPTGAEPRVTPTNVPTQAPIPLVPPGFTPLQPPPPLALVPPPVARTTVTPDATAPRVPTLVSQEPTYDNTAKGTTRRRRNRGKNTKRNNNQASNKPSAVANAIQGKHLLATINDTAISTPPQDPTIAALNTEFAVPKGFAHSLWDPATGKEQTYRQLLEGPNAAKWYEGCVKEMGRLCQGSDPKTDSGTNTMFFIKHTDVPADKTPTYLRITVEYRSEKDDPYRVRFTCGGDRIQYSGIVSTPTADISVIKILFNSIISTKGARCLGMDLKDFYLNHIMKHYEYMRIPLWAIPTVIMDNYNLWPLVHNGFVNVEIRKGMYGLPQAGRIAYEGLIEHLAPHGYSPAPHTPGLWRHETRPTLFTLIVDDFAVKYMSKDDANHLLNALRTKYKIAEDWDANLYAGISIQWDYENGTVDISMPGYTEKALQRFKHPTPKQPEDAPHPWEPPKYGSTVQYAKQPDTSKPLDKAQTKRIQEICGTFLYQARAVNPPILVALGTIASQQASPTEATLQAATQLLDYVATHPDPIIRFTRSEMQLEIASDASYLSESKSRSRAGGYHYLSNKRPTPHLPPNPTDPLPMMNGPVHVHCSIMPMIVSSAAEAEFGGCYYNAKDATILRTALEEMGHPQPPTPIECDNTTGIGILNDTIRQRRSKAMDMRFHWSKDRERQGQFFFHWRHGKENRADYFTKHHSPAHHRNMQKLYMHQPNATERQQQLIGGRTKYTLASLVDSSHLAGLVPGEGVLILPRIRVPGPGRREVGTHPVSPPQSLIN